MSGYTPVFDSVFEGTLCGRWPTLPVWLTILPMADKNGFIDKTLRNISLISGWPENLLQQAIDELMQPDPESRSESDDGRRLVLIDGEHRGWGWRVVNHSKYREKGRKAAYDSERVATGQNAERMKARPAVTRDDPTPPAITRADPLSDSDSDSDSDKIKTKRGEARAARPVSRKRCPAEFQITDDLRAWAKTNAPDVDVDRETERMRDWEYKTGRSDWPAAWRTWMDRAQSDLAQRPGRKSTRRAKTADELDAEWEAANAKQ